MRMGLASLDSATYLNLAGMRIRLESIYLVIYLDIDLVELEEIN